MRSAFRAKGKLPALIAAALLLWTCLALPAAAAEGDAFQGNFDYSGTIDPETGYPRGETVVSYDGRTVVSAAMAYDSVRGMFVYPLEDGTELFCSAADGMILTDRVTIQYSGSQVLTVYRNGEVLDLAGAWELSEPGSYVITQGTQSGTRVCGFTLVPKETNLIHNYSVPEGFLIRGATLDGNETEFSRYYVDMEREGSYRIDYRCPAADRDYALEVRIDRTPPELLLKGSVRRDGKVHSAVEISGLSEGDSISVEHDGTPQKLQINNGALTLTDTGAYSVTVSDAAGNTVSYDFTIMLYLNTNSILFLLLVAAIVCSVFVYAWWKRKSLKVR